MELADLSPFAIRLAHHISQLSENGLPDPISWGSLVEHFRDEDRPHMVEAVFELENAGLITVSGAINVPDGISHIRPSYDLFWRFDPEVFNVEIEEDVATLIRLILDDDALGSAELLHEQVGWTRRRFNPAFARIVEEFPEGRVSQELQADYPSRFVAVTPEDRVSLKRLLENIEASRIIEEMVEMTEPETVTSERSHRMKLNLGVMETEFHAPKWTILFLFVVMSVIFVYWKWPDIDDRLALGFQNRRPVLVSPPDAVTLRTYPRIIEFEWKPLEGAARYILELEGHDPFTGKWFPHPYDSRTPTTDTSLSIEFIGDQPGRWRVLAVDEAGKRSKPSSWHEFYYESDKEL